MSELRGQVSLRRAAILLAAVVLAWGITWPVNKVVVQHLTPLWSVSLRTILGALALFAITASRGRVAPPRREDWPIVVSVTLLHIVGFSVLMAVGLTQVSAGRSVVLAYTTPLWVAPGASLFLGERLTARQVLGIALGLLGLVVLFNPLAFDWSNRAAVVGNGALLLAAFLWAGSIVHIRGHRWHGTPFEITPWQTLLAAAIVTPVALAVDGLPAAHWDVPLALMLLYAAVPGSALPYWAVAVANRRLPAVTTALGLLGVPIVSIVTATLALGEAVTPSLVAAVALVIGGVAIGTLGAGREAGAPRASV